MVWIERLDAMIDDAIERGEPLREIRLTWAMQRAICRELSSPVDGELFRAMRAYDGIPVIVAHEGRADGIDAYFFGEVEKQGLLSREAGG